MRLSQWQLLGLVPVVLIIFGIEMARASHGVFPVPFLALYCSTVFAAAIAGRIAGTLAGLVASAEIIHGYFSGFGPATLTGNLLNLALGISILTLTGFFLGRLRYQRDAMIVELAQRSQKLETDLAVRTLQKEQKESEIAKSEARLRAALRIAELGHFEFDIASGNCVFCSERHAAHLGLTVEEFLQETAGKEPKLGFVHPDDRHTLRQGIASLNSGRSSLHEYRIVTKTGEIRHILEMGEPEFDKHGKPVCEIGTSMDMTWLRHAESKLRESHKLEAVGQLTAGIAHDFNNLLAVIMGNLELLGDAESKADEEGMIQAALGATSRGAALTSQLLSFGRKAHLNPQVLNIPAAIDDLFELFRRTLAASIEIVVDRSAASNCVARIDRPQFESALLNLVVNSADAMPQGGRLRISSGRANLNSAQITSMGVDISPGPYVSVSIADTGLGMTEAVRAKAFEPFFTTKQVGEGSGLGLSMVVGFVRQSGGDVRVVSTPGKGTIITLFFKAEQQSTGQSEPLPVAKGKVAEVSCVLLVEDDDSVRKVTMAQLETHGYRVIATANGTEGLNALQSHNDIAILLSDIVMPGSLQGDDLAVQALRLRPNLKVVLMSGYCDFDHFEVPNLASNIPVLAKPIRWVDLEAALRNSLAEEKSSHLQNT